VKFINNLVTVLLLSNLLFISCRNELIIDEVAPNIQGLKANSNVATLMERTTLNDGSVDNIIDNANCFTVVLPVTVIVNGSQIVVNTNEDFNTVEAVFDEFDDDDDTIEIVFPINIVFSDFTTTTVNNINDFNDLRAQCNGENQVDDDIECVDFNYPISATIFDTVTEQSENVTLSNDDEMHQFLESIEKDDVVSISFPIFIRLFDGTDVQINNLNELETAIDNAKDSCDEDDDFDFNDDDCINCSQEQFGTILTRCTDWTVDKLERNNEKLTDNFNDFTFNFLTDGSINVKNGSTNYEGTWSASGSGLNIVVTINISDLPDFNADWNLHEINDNSNDSKVDLRLPNDDRLRLKSTSCN